MAVGPIQFSVSTNPIDALNARLLAMGRSEIIVELKSTPALVSGGHYHDITYIARNGGRKAYSIFQGPMDSANDLVSNLIAHINAVELTAKEAHSSHGSLNLSPQRNPIDALNNRLKALGRKEIITSIKSFPFADGYNHDVYYINGKGEEWTYGYSQGPADSMDHFAEKFFAHLGAAEQVAKERAARIAADQKKSDLAAQQKFGKGEIKLNVPSDYVTRQGTAKQESTSTADDYTVWIWGIEYPNARVEYRESFDVSVPRFGSTSGVYRAGAKTIGVPRTDEIFDISLKYKNGDVTVLKCCTWITDGEVHCETILKNGMSSAQSWVGSIAQQQKGVEWGDGSKWGDESKWGDPIPASKVAVGATGTAHLNGVPVGVLTNVEYGDATVMNLSTKPAGVTNDTLVKQEAIDRGYAATMQAIDVPTRDEIKCSLLERVANDGSRKVSEVMVDLVAESTHETYKAIAQVAEGLRLQQDDRRAIQKAFDELMDPACRLPNYIDFMQNRRITGVTTNKDGNPVVSLETTLPWPPEKVNIPVDFSVQIGDDVPKENLSMPDNIAPIAPVPTLKARAKQEAVEVAYRTAAIKLPELVRKQLVKRMASKGGKAKPSQARLSLAEEMLSGDEGSLIVAGILSLALSASPEFIKSKMPWLDLDRLARELRIGVETRIACAVADMLGMYLDGALEALKEAFGGSQLLLAEGGKSDESALFNGAPKAETVRV